MSYFKFKARLKVISSVSTRVSVGAVTEAEDIQQQRHYAELRKYMFQVQPRLNTETNTIPLLLDAEQKGRRQYIETLVIQKKIETVLIKYPCFLKMVHVSKLR